MCYNWHMPLVLDPADIWLLVLQGFRVHLMFRADKEYVATTFKDLDQLAKSNKKLMKITEPSLGDLSACKDADFEEKLFATINKAMDKMWTKTHKADSWGSDAMKIDE